MTISYTALLGLAQPVTGTETGQWGTVVNDEITALLEDAVANAASISVTAGNVTLSTTNGSSNQARMSTLIITGTPGTTRNVVAPSQAKIYVVINQSDGAVVIKGAATSGVTIGAGQTAQVAWNGSDFVEIGNYVHGNFVVNGNLSVNGDSTLGNAGADTTTINGQVIAANSNISKTTTLSASAPALAWIKGATYTDTGTAGGTTQALAPFTVFSTPTLSTSNIVTYTDAATVYIAGAPAAAGSATITNPYSLYVAAGNAYFGASVSATTLDLTNLEVTNIKAKDGTASMTLADSTGIITLSATAGTANGVAYLNGSRALTTGSALTYNGTSLTIGSGSGSPFARINGGTAAGLGGGYAIDRNGTEIGGVYSGSWYTSGSAAVNTVALGTTTAEALLFGINYAEQMRLTSTGLGIGTSSPAGKLHVAGQARIQDSANAANYISIGSGANAPRGGNSVMAQTGSMVMGTEAASNLIFITNAAEAARLDSSGNLGLGVTPKTDWNADYDAFQLGAGSSLSGHTSTSLNFTVLASNQYVNTAGTSKFINDGYAPRYLQRGDTGEHYWYTTNSGLAGGNVTNTQAMTLDASGNLGVGTTSPGARLDVVGNYARFSENASGAEVYLRGYYASIAAAIQVVNNFPLLFLTNNVERARITSVGGFETRPAANGHAVFNEDGVDADFRVESDNRTHMLFVDAGTDQVSIGTSSVRTNSTLTVSYWGNSVSNNAQISINANDDSGTGQSVLELLAGSGSANRASRINFLNGVASTTTPRWILISDYDQNGTNDLRVVNASTQNLMTFKQTGEVVFNEDSVDYDFRVESDADTHCLFVDASTDRVGIGTNNPAAKLHVDVARAATVTSAIFGTTGTGVVNDENRLVIRNINTASGQNYGVGIGGLLEASASNQASLLFYTDSGTATTERARITSGGNLLVGIQSQINTTITSIKGTSGTNVLGLQNSNDNNYLITALNSSGTEVFRIAGTGNALNTNGSYGAISDAKMKTDIVDAGSQWSDIKALRFRKFKMKNDPSGLVQLGVVAQEVEQTSPGLVDEHADKDAEGNDLGTTTKSVKTSVLLMKAAVALQEAMARIEKLEAEVAALKGA